MKKESKKENIFYHPVAFKAFICINILAFVAYLWHTYSIMTCSEGPCPLSIYYSDLGWAILMYLVPLVVLILQQKKYILAGYAVVLSLLIEMSIFFTNSPVWFGGILDNSFISLIYLIPYLIPQFLVILAFGIHLFMIARNIDYNLQGGVQSPKPGRIITIMIIYLVYVGFLSLLGLNFAIGCGLGSGCSNTVIIFGKIIFVVLASLPLIITPVMLRLRKKKSSRSKRKLFRNKE